MYPKVLLILYCFHIYFLLEFILAIVATLAQVLLGMELQPQFNEPYLSTTLQDFWGRRWNLMVTNTLRITVYNSTQHALVTRGINKKWAPLVVVFATFVVSGFMHELIFYLLWSVSPTWEVTWFFLLYGLICVWLLRLSWRRWFLLAGDGCHGWFRGLWQSDLCSLPHFGCFSHHSSNLRLMFELLKST